MRVFKKSSGFSKEASKTKQFNTSNKEVYFDFVGLIASRVKDTSDEKTLNKFINRNFNRSIWNQLENQVWVIVHCRNLTRVAKESFRLDVLEKLKNEHQ